MKPATWRDLVEHAERRLDDRQDAWRIAERASGHSRAELVMRWDEPAPARAGGFMESMVERRAAGEPLQYVLGRWGFRTLDLFVDRRVLIPRPETETVVEAALAEARRLAPGRRPRFVDLGTGSGAIALSIATEVAEAEVWATDSSADALAVARANLAGAGSRVATRVRVREGRWFHALPRELAGEIDVVVANPPYVAEGEALPAEVADWEPSSALFSGPSGLEAIFEIVAESPRWLHRPGAVVVEVAPHQAERAVGIAAGAGFDGTEVVADFAGRPRVLVGRLTR